MSSLLPSASKDQLIDEMINLATESKFYSVIEQTLKEILECRSPTPYTYLHKKISLKSKFDNSKSSQYIVELAMYISTANPLLLQKQTIINKIMSLCIEKFNQLKIRKIQTLQFISFILIDLNEKQKQSFLTEISQQFLENQNINIMFFSHLLYYTMVYNMAMKQFLEIQTKVKSIVGVDQINSKLMESYLQNVIKQDSMLKSLNLELNEGENVQSKLTQKIMNLLSEGAERK